MNGKLSSPSRWVEILMVEDNPTDVFLAKEALRHSRFAMDIHVAEDGEAALDFIHHEGRFAHTIDPDLVLLDLTLPRINGWAVLGEIRRTPSLDQVPVVILTGSKSDSDAKLARELKADLYIVKPPDLSHFPIFVNSLDHLLSARLGLGVFPS